MSLQLDEVLLGGIEIHFDSRVPQTSGRNARFDCFHVLVEVEGQ